MKKILVPISFSEASSNSLRMAVSIAKKHNATISLLHCFTGHSFNREFDFGSLSYEEGIRRKLLEFYNQTTGSDRTVNLKIRTAEGSTADTICSISREYELLILSRNPHFRGEKLNTSVDKISYFITRAWCPVLVLPAREIKHDFFNMEHIWHIEQQKNELELINPALLELKLNPELVNTKSLKQNTFTSPLWKDVVDFTKTHKQAQLDHISETFDDEHIDLLVLINRKARLLKRFLKGDVFGIFSQYNVPILIIQNR